MNDLLDTFIEVKTLNSDQFFTVKETLTRMGLVSRKERRNKTYTMAIMSCSS